MCNIESLEIVIFCEYIHCFSHLVSNAALKRCDSICRHSLDCRFSSGVYECIHVSSIVITRWRKASHSCWYHCKSILAVSIRCHFPISVRVCGTQWALTFQKFSSLLKMVWTVNGAIPSSLEISTHVQRLSSSIKTITAWTSRLPVAATGLPASALCWHSSFPWRMSSTHLAIVR